VALEHFQHGLLLMLEFKVQLALLDQLDLLGQLDHKDHRAFKEFKGLRVQRVQLDLQVQLELPQPLQLARHQLALRL
jgi:hypothetical protein